MYGSLEERCNPGYDDLLKSVSQLTLKLEEINHTLGETEAQLIQCEAQVDLHYKDIALLSEGYNGYLAILDDEITDLEDQIEDCDREYGELDNMYTYVDEAKVECEDQVAILSGLNASLSTQIAEMTMLLSGEGAKLAKLEQDIVDAQETCLMEKGGLAHQLATAVSEAETWKDAVNAKTNLTSFLESQLDATVANLSATSSALDALRESPTFCNAAHADLPSANMGLAYFLVGLFSFCLIYIPF